MDRFSFRRRKYTSLKPFWAILYFQLRARTLQEINNDEKNGKEHNV